MGGKSDDARGIKHLREVVLHPFRTYSNVSLGEKANPFKLISSESQAKLADRLITFL